jgi:outer membrane protein insertion porin family
MELSHLVAGVFGGRAGGVVGVDFGERDRVSVDVSGSGLDSGSLLRWIDLPLPLTARVGCSVQFEGEPGSRSSWQGKGEFRVASEETAADRVTGAGTGSFRLDQGRLTLLSEDLEIGAAQLLLELDADLARSPADGLLRLIGETGDARATQLATLKILRGLGLEAPDLVLRPLEGRGAVGAAVFLGDEEKIDLSLGLRSGAWGGQPFDRAALDLTLDDGRLDLRAIGIETGPESLSGSLYWDLEEPLPERVELRATDLEVETARELLGLDLDLAGQLAGELSLTNGPDGPRGGGSLVWTGGAAFGEPLERASAQIVIEAGLARLEPIFVAGPAVRADAVLAWDLEAGTGRLDLLSAELDLATFRATTDDEPLAAGSLAVEGGVDLDSGGATGSFDIRLEALAIGGYGLGSADGSVTIDPIGIQARLEGSGWAAQGGFGLEGDLPLQARLSLDRLVVEPPLGAVSGIWARLSGSLEAAGPLARPGEIQVEGSLSEAVLGLGAHRLRLAGEMPVRYAAGRLAVDSVRLVGPDFDFEARLRYDNRTGGIEGVGRGHLALALVSAFVPDLRATGRAEVDLTVGGTVEEPDLAGSLHVEQGRLRWLGFPRTLEQFDLQLSLNGPTAEVVRYSGVVGGGEVGGSGWIRFGDGGLEGYRLEFEGRGVRLEWPEGFQGAYDADLSLEGDAGRSTLRGRVDVLRGVYDEEFELMRALGVGTREYSTDELGDLGHDLRFDVDLEARDNVWVRNELAELEARFDLHLGGSLQRPELTGRMSVLEGGRLEFRNARYEILAGHVDFVDLDRLDPYVYLRAETRVGDYEIYLRVEGTLNRFEYELTSSPALAQQDIIALLASGETLQDLTGGPTGEGADFTGDLAANYFAGALTAPFERQLRKVLGLERVQINPLIGDGSSDATTRVTVGKKISDDVTVIVASEMGTDERQLYQVEWQATPHHLVSLQTDTRAGTGGLVRYRNRYWWKRRDAASALPSGPEEGERAGETSAPEVAELLLNGVSSEELEALQKRIPAGPGDEFRRSDLFAGAEAIRRFYIGDGRILVSVKASALPAEEDPQKVVLVYEVEPGPRVRVLLEGVSKKDERRLRARLEELWVESLFAEDIYADSLGVIRRYFERRGFYAVDAEFHVEGSEQEPVVRFSVDTGPPVRVARVVIEGAEQVPQERVRRQMLTGASSLFSRPRLDPEVLEQDLAAVRNLYRDQGHLRVRISQPRIRLAASADSAEIFIEIEEGPRFSVGDVGFSEDLPFAPERLRAWCGLAVGDLFSPTRLLQAESGLRAGLDGEGYPQAVVRGSVELRDAVADLHFEIEPGKVSRVGEVAIEGNLLTRDKVIRRELVLGPGDLISREKMLRSQHRLYRLGVFRSVRVSHEPMEEADPELQRLVVRVDEARPLAYSVGAGYDSDRGPQGSFSTTHDNLGGRVRTVGIQAFVSDTLRRAQIVGREPRLFGRTLPTLIDYSMEYREDPGYTMDRRSTAIRVDRRINETWAGYVRYNYQRQDLSNISDPGAPEDEKLEDLQLGDIGLTLLRDRRDDPLMTTSGTYFTISARIFNELLLSESDFVKSRVAASGTWSFGNGSSLATSVRVGVLNSYGSTTSVPISERFFAGGQSTIRGFKLDEVGPQDDGRPTGGEASLILNQEFRFPVWGHFGGVLFYDAGNVYSDLSGFDPTDLRHVLGAGVRFNAPFGPVRLEYGWKLDREAEESSGELHFAIGAVF